MVNRRVLISLDGKAPSEKAFRWYLDNMKKAGDHLVLFHCTDLPHGMLPGMMTDVELVTKQYQKVRQEADTIIANATELLNHEEDVKAYSVIKFNTKPHEAVVQAAWEEKVDHIVMGTRDLGTIKRAMVGSVSTEVVRDAHVPVTIVKTKE